ncbi:membrane protein insertion efficiency factor YidD [Caviibacterium pharyngocola]|uniref:Membrane protein insertion efficiency factor YidD n=1 Tax=Caviibacterium pharyngocola TaxID=28159 RepID=A0A2M8RTC6_9PAST|nr:membrane protein insertion efficiency factor YidD [Caviibacterium pharyngocola]PJG82142.1 membrane protein insertion efficiency factor YidD [Caviibacterium pharyngocola]
MVWLSIQFILLYQRLAPNKIRDACRFEPSCSNYAILALKKYGFLKGWKMTLNRLNRCKFPNSGEDYP